MHCSFESKGPPIEIQVEELSFVFFRILEECELHRRGFSILIAHSGVPSV